MTLTVIISLIVGLAAGCFINYAITFTTGQGRNIGICVLGALIGGALIPALLSLSGVWAALIGSVLGVLVLTWIMFKMVTRAHQA